MPNIRCQNCGLLMQVPPGGRRLCGCGAWLSGDDDPAQPQNWAPIGAIPLEEGQYVPLEMRDPAERATAEPIEGSGGAEPPSRGGNTPTAPQDKPDQLDERRRAPGALDGRRSLPPDPVVDELEPAAVVGTPLAAHVGSAGPAEAGSSRYGGTPHGLPASTPEGQAWPRIEGDLSAIERLNDGYRRIRRELSKVIVGQENVIEELLICVFSRGHALLVGVPGLAKTLMIRSLAESLSLSFSRVQFTPDLMPSDITGTEVLQEDKSTGQRMFKFLHGPVFANIVLADEVNRTPPKTQASLLEAMAERQVTVGGARHRLPDPFFVLATQNPIEQEGTYPLPEAQQDRFMFNIFVDYPSEDEEFRIVETTTSTQSSKIERVLSATDILEMQDIVRKVPVAPYVIRYALKFARLTRKGSRVGSTSSSPASPGTTSVERKAARPSRDIAEVPDFVRDYVTWGAGPRASQFLILAAKARAVLHGRYYVSCEDVRAVATPVLRHRIITNFNAEAEGIKPDDIVRRLIDIIPRDPNDSPKT